jgi:hypothetical protein
VGEKSIATKVKSSTNLFLKSGFPEFKKGAPFLSRFPTFFARENCQEALIKRVLLSLKTGFLSLI